MHGARNRLSSIFLDWAGGERCVGSCVGVRRNRTRRESRRPGEDRRMQTQCSEAGCGGHQVSRTPRDLGVLVVAMRMEQKPPRPRRQDARLPQGACPGRSAVMEPDSLHAPSEGPARARFASLRPVLPEPHSLPPPSRDSLEHILVPRLNIF